eukprot:5596588-Amphidinium_carterae.1
MDFMESLGRWEHMISRYQMASRENLADSIKVAVVLEHAPTKYNWRLPDKPINQFVLRILS